MACHDLRRVRYNPPPVHLLLLPLGFLAEDGRRLLKNGGEPNQPESFTLMVCYL